MATSPDQRPEHPSTYFMQDRSNQEELSRLHIQDQLVTTMLGGVLPEQPDPTRFSQVLDVGCGTGGWLIEAAKTYPTMLRLDGVDISRTVVEFAQAQAEAAQVGDRVTFHIMDALRMLEFPANTFDLVNQRSGAGYLRTWDWRKLLEEFRRVTRPGGVIRVTEGDWAVESTSPALTRLFDLLLKAFYQSGHSFTPTSDGVTARLVSLLEQASVQNVQVAEHSTECRPGTAFWQSFYNDMKLVFRTTLPFQRKWIKVPDDYEDLYQQMLREIEQPDFVARGRMLTAWGTSPDKRAQGHTTAWADRN
ncbi:MAG TPA: class I SAM-dependent methyltransferase [Ktedonobacteraceae bacterium]|nr:class I SAM-dependent methyltransferase [Ktedonobacteraceae bacterium]